MLATWPNINKTVFDCVANPEKYTHCSGDGNDCRRLCKMIAENAVVASNGQWVFQVEHAEWNEGALLYADLNPATLGQRVEPRPSWSQWPPPTALRFPTV